MRRWVVLVLVALVVLGAAVGVYADRAAQRGRLEALLARVEPLEAAIAETPEETAQALYEDALALEDRWIRSEKNALVARLRHLRDRIDERRRGHDAPVR